MFFNKITLTAGFALFSMFFGSGNLIFPLNVGRESFSAYPYAILGLCLTAVLVPVLGFLGMVFSGGDRVAYFKKLGKYPTFFLTLLMLSLMGPFGVMPRCIGLSYGGLMLISNMPLWAFSAGFCLLTGILVWRPNKVVSIIGVFLTPFKLGGLFLLTVTGLYFSTPPINATAPTFEIFSNSISQGYQTMDLLAAFFFGCTIVEFIKNRIKDKHGNVDMQKVIHHSFYAGLIGASLLGCAYAGFIALGASYADQVMNVSPESLLVTVSGLALGPVAIPIVGFTICVSCLATATILAKLFADFLHHDMSQNKISYHQSVIITMTVCFIFSLLGFKMIVGMLAGFLSWLYPLLILYAVYKVYDSVRNMNSTDTTLKKEKDNETLSA
ncbi:MAG: branched-chain amino acid transporter [Alphaproteobacteria bacterium CG_4_10_14_0_8_um_filter_37_21]|nr:MAG: branched-chain amino acid transporter [Alphaproteobacteria bacterium CG_4_10_14_0_8_um_filter_37_21]